MLKYFKERDLDVEEVSQISVILFVLYQCPQDSNLHRTLFILTSRAFSIDPS